MIKIFGHRAPDTDSAGSAIIWAWYLSEVRGVQAEARILGELNTEAAFVLDKWGFENPEVLHDVEDGEPVIIVDTNNPAELPDNILNADIREIIDHHLLHGGLSTAKPLTITLRPLACTATILHDLMGADTDRMPRKVAGLMLSCIISDTLEFRSPTTTPTDEGLARELARRLDVDIAAIAADMFEAKSDVSEFDDKQLLRMDSKKFVRGQTALRISVLETTCPEVVMDRKPGLIDAMSEVATEDGVDQVLLFVVDILSESATLLIPNEAVRDICRKSFGTDVAGDEAVLPGIVSRKKQIIPRLVT